MLMHTASKWIVELSVYVKVDTVEMDSPAAVSSILHSLCMDVHVLYKYFYSEHHWKFYTLWIDSWTCIGLLSPIRWSVVGGFSVYNHLLQVQKT